ncbi:19542_t:CDS:2, partial [Racocetra persica]
IRLANEKNLAWLEQKKVQQTQTDALLEVEAQKIYDKINNLSFDFILKKDEKGEPFGSVGFKEILTSLEKVEMTMATTKLNNFEIKKLEDKNLNPYYLIVNNDNRDEAYFCFERMVKEGWDIL